MLMKFYDDEEEDNFYLCGIEVEILLGYLCLQAKKPLHPQDKSRKLFLPGFELTTIPTHYLQI